MRLTNKTARDAAASKVSSCLGPSVTCRKLGEYGGNTMGFGSRSVLGGGWPGDVLRVDGDTLTVSFEMRSGREHNTPDRALWGFRLSVQAQEQEDTSCIKPFIADIAITLAELLSASLEVRRPSILPCHEMIAKGSLQWNEDYKAGDRMCSSPPLQAAPEVHLGETKESVGNISRRSRGNWR